MEAIVITKVIVSGVSVDSPDRHGADWAGDQAASGSGGGE